MKFIYLFKHFSIYHHAVEITCHDIVNGAVECQIPRSITVLTLSRGFKLKWKSWLLVTLDICNSEHFCKAILSCHVWDQYTNVATYFCNTATSSSTSKHVYNFKSSTYNLHVHHSSNKLQGIWFLRYASGHDRRTDTPITILRSHLLWLPFYAKKDYDLSRRGTTSGATIRCPAETLIPLMFCPNYRLYVSLVLMWNT